MIDSREVGRRIAALRQSSGLTQMQLAAMMNVSHQAVSKWEGGSALPDIQTLMELTRFFGLTVEQLVGEEAAEAAPEGSARPEAEHAQEARERTEGTEAMHMNIQQLLQMAPYMTKEAVAEIAMGIEEPLSAGQIARLAPYLAPECVEELVKKHHPEFTWESLRRLAPHMRRETVDEIARAVASGRETIKFSEDSFNRAMSDLGRAFDGIGKGVDKAVRRAIRIGESMFNEVSSAFSDMATEAEDAQLRSDRARELRRRAFERALADERWDWLGAHVDELEDGDELKLRIAARARELGMRDWLEAHMGACLDEAAVREAAGRGDWDWLRQHFGEMEPSLQQLAIRAALEAENWSWFAENGELGEDAEAIVLEIWRKGNRALALELAHENFTAPEQFDALFEEALASEDEETADLLWDEISSGHAQERLLALAGLADWQRVRKHIDRADPACVEGLMELAVDQGNFDAIDLLNDYL